MMEGKNSESGMPFPRFNVPPRQWVVPKPLTAVDIVLTQEEIARAVEQVEDFKSGFICYPAIRPVMEAMNSLMAFGSLGKRNSASSRCILITGPSRCGKTTILANFAAMYPEYRSNGRRMFPALYVKVPSDCTKRALAVAILRALKVPEELATKGTSTTLMVRVENNLIKQGVNVILFDDFHHLMKSDNAKVLRETAEYIKSILEKCICSFVMCGLDGAAKVYESNEQVQGRSNGHFKLGPFRWDDEHDRALIDIILREFHDSFPLPLDVDLFSEGMAWRLHHLSGGLFGRIADFLAAVATLAFMRRAQSVGYDLFLEVAHNLGGAERSWVNPFALTDGLLPTDAVKTEMTRLRRGNRQPKPKDFPRADSR